MILVTRNDIEQWAESFDSKGNFPILISRLVQAITPPSTDVNFPSGSSAFVGGWDGVVNCAENIGPVPEGISLWEFGTEGDNKGKADEDYDKRTKDTEGYDPLKCTFIFATPRFWKFKDKWKNSKLSEGKWKDIRVYDSRDIEQWLDRTPAVSRWFSSYINKYPFDGIITVEEFWKEWAIGPVGELPPRSVTAGRDHESVLLLSFLNSPPAIKAIKASSKDEAIAFIIASAKQYEDQHRDKFFSKSLVINDSANFRSIRINTTSLNLIAKFDEPQPLYAAVSEGHHVLVPLGADDTFNQDIITLPFIDRDGQIESLVSMGLTDEDAKKYSKESGRNITILKRLLKFPQNKLDWIKPEYVREIIPALLLGRWDENKTGDRELLEALSKEKYEDYIIKVSKWKGDEASPFMQIGNTWRLTSPMDAWTNLSPFILKSDLESLSDCFYKAFKNGNPYVNQDTENTAMPLYFNREATFSTWSREGLTQSLILIGLYGEGMKIPNISSSQLWVDTIISTLLLDADEKLWVSLNHEMPLIAEASPSSFFEAVYKSLTDERKPIMAMFKEEEGFLSAQSNHTGLLWALEGLAWMPEFLYDASMILSKLSVLDPGGSTANRPMNSLIEIFKPWHYQTLATFDERMEVLTEIAQFEAEAAWMLLIKMLPDYHAVGFSTHKMRWRMFDRSFNNKYTYQEIYKTHSLVISLLLSIFDYSENKFSQLIFESVNLLPPDRKKVLDFAEQKYSEINQEEYTTWNTLRRILSQHRSHPDANWALPEFELNRYEKLYYALEPSDDILRYIWLFDDHWPDLPEGNIYDEKNFAQGHIQQEKKLDDKRIAGLQHILNSYGIEKIKELGQTVKQPWFFGDTLAKIINDDSLVFSIVELLKGDKSKLGFVQSFLFRKAIINQLEWFFSLFYQLQKKGYSNKELALLLVPLPQSKELWDFVESTNEEIQKEYWLSVTPHFYNISEEEKILGIRSLVSYKRFTSAIDMGGMFPEILPSGLLIEILKSLATENGNENIRVDHYKINRFFDEIDKRNDIDRQTLIQLEWLFIPILTSYGNQRNPKLLHQELAGNPEFLIEVLKWVYLPKNKKLLDEERNGLSEELIRNRSTQAFHLLHSWKTIPGVSNDGSIDKEFLTNWVKTVRELARGVDRLDVADMQIGQILAQYPEKDLDWPPDEICDIIESINTDSIKRNFSAAIFNKRGSSTRGVFDGGNIERAHAKYFQLLAAKHKKKHPKVSIILSNLAKSYLADAKRQDEEAERSKLEY